MGLVKWVHGLLIILPLVSWWQNRDLWGNIDVVMPLGLMMCVIGTRDPTSRMVLVGCLLFLWDAASRANVIGVRPAQRTLFHNFLRSAGAGGDCPAQLSGTEDRGDWFGWVLRNMWDFTFDAVWASIKGLLRDLGTEFCLTADSVEECKDIWIIYGTVMFGASVSYLYGTLAQGPVQD